MQEQAPSNNIEYSIVIPHYEDVTRLYRCLAFLMQTLRRTRNGSNAEVVVVDNGTHAPLDDIVKNFRKVRFVVEKNKGAAEARNRGVRETIGSAIFFLDADCVPSEDWFIEAVNCIKTCDIVGGRIDTFDETPPPRNGAQAFEQIFAFDQERYVKRKNFSVTANLLTWRHIFEDVGGFKNLLSEDVDWCLRAKEKGYQLVYNDRLLVRHPTRSDWAALRKKWRRLTLESFALKSDTRFKNFYWSVRALLVFLSPLLHTSKIFSTPKPLSVYERLLAFVVLLRLRILRSYWMMRQSVHLDI